MLKNLLKNLSASLEKAEKQKDGHTENAQEQIALAALMIRLARSDNDYSESEAERILALLARHYGLSAEEATALRQKAQEVEKQSADTVRFTRELKQSVPYEERLHIIRILWSVVLEDGRRDDEENTMMRLIAGLLGISDVESHSVRRRIVAHEKERAQD